MSSTPIPGRLTPATGWWAAYEDGARHFVVPILGFDDHGAPYVWSAETHQPVPAVRTSFIGVVSDAYRAEYGELVATAIKNANNGHRGEATSAPGGSGQPGPADGPKDTIREGIEKAREVIHGATRPGP